ncbi:MAG: hypothetical protein ACRDP6_08375 [Actinoallomurus sp.]
MGHGHDRARDRRRRAFVGAGRLRDAFSKWRRILGAERPGVPDHDRRRRWGGGPGPGAGMTRNRLLLGFGVLFAAGFVLVGYSLAGVGGSLVAFGVAWTGVLLGMRLLVPAPAEPPPDASRRREMALENAAYPAYRRIETALLAARHSARDYDIKARRLLGRLAVSRVVAARGVSEDEAWPVLCAHVGERLWPWLRPSWPPSGDADGGGVDAPTLAALVRKLEEL